MGMDSNVTGRCGLLDNQTFPEPKIRVILALDLSEQTHGNATGMGVADIITRRLSGKIDWKVTYTNCLTGLGPRQAAMPYPAETEREAIRISLDYLAAHIPLNELRAIRVRDTLSLEKLWVSEAVARELNGQAQYSFEGEPSEMSFDGEGNLPDVWR